MNKEPSTILIIAGSDSGGGAGIQADIKTSQAHGVFATTAITALTAQNTQGVQGIQNTRPEFVSAQIKSVLDDIKIDAVKIGMLSNSDIIEEVAKCLKERNPEQREGKPIEGAKDRAPLERNNKKTPIVLDTVMAATSSDRLLEESAITTLKTKLFPLATLITPNIPEAEILSDIKIRNPEDMKKAGEKIMQLGVRNLLLKGGHLEGDEVIDILFTENKITEFRNPKIETRNTHGTGCSLASAIACNLANGLDLQQAVQEGIAYIHNAITTAPNIGKGNGPINHLHNMK